jgi:DNA-binding transcriptional ArsR family regulator
MGLESTFAALSDPTDWPWCNCCAKARAAGELAEALDMSAPALSRHLKVLRASGLIQDAALEEDARVRLFRLEPAAFADLRDWLTEVEAFWGGQLQAFKAHAEKSRKPAARARRK